MNTLRSSTGRAATFRAHARPHPGLEEVLLHVRHVEGRHLDLLLRARYAAIPGSARSPGEVAHDGDHAALALHALHEAERLLRREEAARRALGIARGEQLAELRVACGPRGA